MFTKPQRKRPVRKEHNMEQNGNKDEMTDDDDFYKHYSPAEVIAFLKKRNFEKFTLTDTSASLFMKNNGLFVLEASDRKISDETIELAVRMLGDLAKCVRLAKPWLEHFNLKNDRWHPDALDAGYEVSSIYVGTYDCGGPFRSPSLGVTISFSTVNYYPCQFTVKYHRNLWPFAVEEWVE